MSAVPALVVAPSAASSVGAVDPGPDFDGDGYGDVVAGVSETDGDLEYVGAVHVLYGSPDGPTATGSQRWWEKGRIRGDLGSGDLFGAALAYGDFDHDGYDDLAVGAPGNDNQRGSVTIIRGSDRGLTSKGNRLLTQNTRGVPGSAEAFDRFGEGLVGADFKGDGFDDLAVSVPEDGVANDPVVHIFYGAENGLRGTGSTAVGGIGADKPWTWGSKMSAGEFDGDGYADLVVGAPFAAVADAVYAGVLDVFHGSAAGITGQATQTWHQNRQGVADEVENYDMSATSVATGDLDGDGVDDLAIGTEEAVAGLYAGAVHVLYGTAGGLTSAGSQFWTENSPGVPDQAGTQEYFSTVAIGDADADGIDDLLVGARGEPMGSPPKFGRGAVFVLPGTAAGVTGDGSQMWDQNTDDIDTDKPSSDDRMGQTLGMIDTSGDGHFDAIIGVPGEKSPEPAEAGAIELLLGDVDGLTAVGAQLWSQESPGIADRAERDEHLGIAVLSR